MANSPAKRALSQRKANAQRTVCFPSCMQAGHLDYLEHSDEYVVVYHVEAGAEGMDNITPGALPCRQASNRVVSS